MPFDAEEIERMTPPIVWEVQDYYARKFLADRKRALFEACKPIPWPHRIGVWHVNDAQRRLERELTIRDGRSAR